MSMKSTFDVIMVGGGGNGLAAAVSAAENGARLVNMDVTYGPELCFIPPKNKTFQKLLPTWSLLAKLMNLIVPLMLQFLMSRTIKRLEESA